MPPEWRNAMVARPVGKSEIRAQPEARKACKAEWDRLRKIRTWEEDKVREWSKVRKEARQRSQKVHILRIVCICVEKGAELKKDDKARKYKGRCVCLGNDVRDEYGAAALFAELSSAPVSLEAGKVGDMLGCQFEWDIQQSDATQAYTQSLLHGTPTWVRLPRE